MRGLDGKTAIVAGGSTLIGQDVAEALAGYGCNVVIADINAADGEAAAKKLGAKARFIRCDITSDAEIAALVKATVEATGRLDYLVNVACTYLDNGAETTRADWLTAFNVNVVGSVMLMQAARPHLKKNKGAIVNFGSISARVAQTGRWVYPVSKAAILQLTRNQAMDLAPDGIRVNAVSPGWTWSNIMVELTKGNRAKTDGVAQPVPSARPHRQSRRSRGSGRVPALGQCELHHRHRHPRRWRLHRDGPGARRARDSASDGIERSQHGWRSTGEADEFAKRVITIVGGGQSGLQLGNGLLSGRLRRPPRAGPHGRRHPQRQSDVEPMHVRQGLELRARARAQFLGQGMPDRRFDQLHRSGARRVRQQGDRLERHARQAGAGGRPARQISALDAGIRKARRHDRIQGGGAAPTSKNTPPIPISSSSPPARAISPVCSNATRRKASSTRRSARSR